MQNSSSISSYSMNINPDQFTHLSSSLNTTASPDKTSSKREYLVIKNGNFEVVNSLGRLALIGIQSLFNSNYSINQKVVAQNFFAYYKGIPWDKTDDKTEQVFQKGFDLIKKNSSVNFEQEMDAVINKQAENKHLQGLELEELIHVFPEACEKIPFYNNLKIIMELTEKRGELLNKLENPDINPQERSSTMDELQTLDKTIKSSIVTIADDIRSKLTKKDAQGVSYAIKFIDFLKDSDLPISVEGLNRMICMMNNHSNYNFNEPLNYFNRVDPIFGLSENAVFNLSGINFVSDYLKVKGKDLNCKICENSQLGNEIANLKDKEDGCYSFIVKDSDSLHVTPIYIEKKNGKYQVLITDSLGTPSKEILQQLAQAELQPVDVYCLQEQRQVDKTNCPIFALNDLKVLAKFHEKGKNVFKYLDSLNKTTTTTKSFNPEQEDVATSPPSPLSIKLINNLPPAMIKTTQYLSKISTQTKEMEQQTETIPNSEISDLKAKVKKHTVKDINRKGEIKNKNNFALDRWKKYTAIILKDYIVYQANAMPKT